MLAPMLPSEAACLCLELVAEAFSPCSSRGRECLFFKARPVVGGGSHSFRSYHLSFLGVKGFPASYLVTYSFHIRSSSGSECCFVFVWYEGRNSIWTPGLPPVFLINTQWRLIVKNSGVIAESQVF